MKYLLFFMNQSVVGIAAGILLATNVTISESWRIPLLVACFILWITSVASHNLKEVSHE